MDTNPYTSEDSQLIDIDELKTWIIFEDENILAINKPGWVVCHPSKNGPLSSLVGACRIYTNSDKLHLISRLDRETSGIIVIAKNKKYASICQKAIQDRQVHKEYLTILTGNLKQPITVNQHLARDMDSPVYVKVCARKSNSSKSAKTDFIPIEYKNGHTLTRVIPFTGRKHQIRAHAEYLNHHIVGDKIYGGDPSLFLEFIELGWTQRLQDFLKFHRQALHAHKIHFQHEEFDKTFEAPIPEDMQHFHEHGFIK